MDLFLRPLALGDVGAGAPVSLEVARFVEHRLAIDRQVDDTAVGAGARMPEVAERPARRQVREIPGLMEGTAQPDSATCVDISTKSALQGMLLPGGLAISFPVLAGLLLGPAGLAGMLIGGRAILRPFTDLLPYGDLRLHIGTTVGQIQAQPPRFGTPTRHAYISQESPTRYGIVDQA